MRICDSEENRRKLAWLVPGYILLAWFFCVVFQVVSHIHPFIHLPPEYLSPKNKQPNHFQPLGLTSVPGHGNNNDYNDESLYEIINLQDDPQVRVRTQLMINQGIDIEWTNHCNEDDSCQKILKWNMDKIS